MEDIEDRAGERGEVGVSPHPLTLAPLQGEGSSYLSFRQRAPSLLARNGGSKLIINYQL